MAELRGDCDDTILIGDVFQDRLFLEADDILFIKGPPAYETTSVAPEPDDKTAAQLRWSGLFSFDDQRPAVTFTAAGEGTTGDPGTPDGGGPGSGDGDGDGFPIRIVALAGGLLMLGIGFGAGYRRWRTTPDQADALPHHEEDHTGDDSVSQPQEAVTNPSDPGELMTDEDRVVTILKTEGGRLRQTAIAERLGWSDSKTSRVLSDMVETGTVEKLRIGRENVIDLNLRDQDEE